MSGLRREDVPADGKWHHATMIFDYKRGRWVIYVDGKPVRS